MLIVWMLSTSSAFAYSYGKPDEEPIAEAYKKAAAALAKDQPDFKTAKTELQTVRKEIEQHAEMGPGLAEAISEQLEQENGDQALFYWRQVLVRNIERRLNHVENNFNDYANNKVLLAKANGTFQVLALHLKQKDPSLVTEIETEFQHALTALGNPGLFGVGQKPADQNLFNQSSKKIKDELINEYIPQNETVLSGGKGHVKAGESSGIKAASDNPLAKWIPLLVIVGVIIISVVVFMYLGKRKNGKA